MDVPGGITDPCVSVYSVAECRGSFRSVLAGVGSLRKRQAAYRSVYR